MTRAVLGAAALLLLASVPAWADAVTYKGFRGVQQIIVELTDMADGPVMGRYSVLADGRDVPLVVMGQSATELTLAEELPCTVEICKQSDDEQYLATLGARWNLQFSNGGQTISGVVGAGENSPGEPVSLRRIGSRAYERSDSFPYYYFTWNDYDGGTISLLSTPYDYAKMQVPLIEGSVILRKGGEFRYVSDPRTKFEFPRVVSLPDGGAISAINRALDEQRWSTNLEGFACLSTQYLSAGWAGDYDTGYSALGDIDLENLSVEYMSSRIMAIIQSGSTRCGGASPYNHSDYSTFDVRTGASLDLSHIFAGWVPTRDGAVVPLAEAQANPAAYDWAPNLELIHFVQDNRVKDAAHDLGCETDRNISEYLDISFKDDDVAVFLISGIDQAACSGEVLAVPISQLPPALLAPEAAQYFPG